MEKRNQYRLTLPQRHDKQICRTDVLVKSGADEQVFRVDHEPVPANKPVNELPRDEILIHAAPNSDVTLACRHTTLSLVTGDWQPLGSFFSESNGLVALPIGSTLDIQFAGQVDATPAPAPVDEIPTVDGEPVEPEPAPVEPAKPARKKRTK